MVILMKKVLFIILLFFPLLVLAYSDYIIPGGDTLGIEVNSKGVVVVGFYKVDGTYINRELRIGDSILEVNNYEVESSNDLVKLIEENMNVIDAVKHELDYKKSEQDNGISALKKKYQRNIDPETGIYGVLGHSLNVSGTNQLMDVKTGYSYDAEVVSFTRSVNGSPGSKNADIDKNSRFGTIEVNSNYGIFGKADEVKNKKLMKVGTLDDVSLGEAYIYTTNLDNEVVKYEIEILNIDKDNYDKNIYFEVVDTDLLKMSGGIVQGMSGSPIIQNDMIIGAVTRVLVDDVDRGYGISIVTMLEEGDKLQ